MRYISQTSGDPENTRISTHWVGCWRVHHACAIAIIEQVLDGAIDDGVRRLIDSPLSVIDRENDTP